MFTMAPRGVCAHRMKGIISLKKEPILKPMSVARNDFINDLTDLINKCMLPPFVIEEVLKDTYNQISLISKRQLENDMKSYQEALEKAAGKSVPVK